jgi:hypothetical protein
VQNLFNPDVLGWPQLHDSLHVYVLPDPQFAASVQSAAEVIGQFEYCAPVASRWMHATVTRIPWWRNEVDVSALEKYGHALTAIAADLSAFAIPMFGPVVHETSVGVMAETNGSWQSLVDCTRTAAEQVFGTDRVLPPPPPMPHVSLGYGTADHDSGPLERALCPVESSATLTVDVVHFVAVHQNPSEGTFTWDSISSHALAPADL